MATGWKIGATIAAALVLGWWLWPSHEAVVERGLEAKVSSDTPAAPLATDAGNAKTERVALTNEANSAVVPPTASKSAPNDRAALDVHVRWGDDGTPAAGIFIG